MLSVVALLLTVVGLGSPLPQLNIPANDNIFRSFPVTSSGGVQGEVTSISIAEVRAKFHEFPFPSSHLHLKQPWRMEIVLCLTKIMLILNIGWQ